MTGNMLSVCSTRAYEVVKVNLGVVYGAWLWMLVSSFGILHKMARDCVCTNETIVYLFLMLPH